MQFATFIFALFATLGFAAAAQPNALAPRDIACNAQNIVDACRTGIMTEIDKCIANDWICLCQNYQNLVTCYNNCPKSTERAPVEYKVTSYCAAAAPLISKSLADAATIPVPTVVATSAVVVPTSTESVAETTTASATQAEATAEFTGVASHMVAPVGGLAAVLLGLAGLL